MQKRALGLSLIILGIFAIFLQPLGSLTGFTIAENIASSAGTWLYVFGLGMMIAGGMLTFNSRNLVTRATEQYVPIIEELPRGGYKIHQEDTPIILDTNFLIDTTKDPKMYQKLKRDLERTHDKGYPIIVPDTVFTEFRAHAPGTSLQETERRQNLRELIKKYAVTMEKYDSDWVDKKEQLLGESLEIINEVPKSLAFEWINHKETHPLDTLGSYFKNQLTPEVEKACGDIEGQLRRAKSPGERRKIMHRFAPSSTDAEVLANALFLNNKGRIYGNEERYSSLIISNDDHIKQAVSEIRSDKDNQHRRELFAFDRLGSF
jgi:predicted nucleic acid-binding protein